MLLTFFSIAVRAGSPRAVLTVKVGIYVGPINLLVSHSLTPASCKLAR